jgi:hypothetical protein
MVVGSEVIAALQSDWIVLSNLGRLRLDRQIQFQG